MKTNATAAQLEGEKRPFFSKAPLVGGGGDTHTYVHTAAAVTTTQSWWRKSKRGEKVSFNWQGGKEARCSFLVVLGFFVHFLPNFC